MVSSIRPSTKPIKGGRPKSPRHENAFHKRLSWFPKISDPTEPREPTRRVLRHWSWHVLLAVAALQSLGVGATTTFAGPACPSPFGPHAEYMCDLIPHKLVGKQVKRSILSRRRPSWPPPETSVLRQTAALGRTVIHMIPGGSRLGAKRCCNAGDTSET